MDAKFSGRTSGRPDARPGLFILIPAPAPEMGRLVPLASSGSSDGSVPARVAAMCLSSPIRDAEGGERRADKRAREGSPAHPDPAVAVSAQRARTGEYTMREGKAEVMAVSAPRPSPASSFAASSSWSSSSSSAAALAAAAALPAAAGVIGLSLAERIEAALAANRGGTPYQSLFEDPVALRGGDVVPLTWLPQIARFIGGITAAIA